jgi:hypothetical protein
MGVEIAKLTGEGVAVWVEVEAGAGVGEAV